jgi:hypothetical protein
MGEEAVRSSETSLSTRLRDTKFLEILSFIMTTVKYIKSHKFEIQVIFTFDYSMG